MNIRHSISWSSRIIAIGVLTVGVMLTGCGEGDTAKLRAQIAQPTAQLVSTEAAPMPTFSPAPLPTVTPEIIAPIPTAQAIYQHVEVTAPPVVITQTQVVTVAVYVNSIEPVPADKRGCVQANGLWSCKQP